MIAPNVSAMTYEAARNFAANVRRLGVFAYVAKNDDGTWRVELAA